ncbi:unnamed protein product, partial [marine sediment metagenome]
DQVEDRFRENDMIGIGNDIGKVKIELPTS